MLLPTHGPTNARNTPGYTLSLERLAVSTRTNHPSSTCGCAATLIRNCLCLCFACSSSLSTAYCNLSFFARICFNLNISLALASSLCPPALARALAPESDEERLLRPSSPPDDSRPSRSSQRAIRACSRRSRRSRCDSHCVRRELISGVRESRRDRWAACREDSGRSSKCFKRMVKSVAGNCALRSQGDQRGYTKDLPEWFEGLLTGGGSH